ncbi:MAG: DUF1273 domain-containing protein [Lactovum sp.]
MKSLLVMGYSSFELGIFSEKDPKLEIIKKAIHQRLQTYLDDGLEWLIFTGNLGFEYWVLQEAKKYKEEYPLNLGTIFSFETQGQNWNESNQIKLSAFKHVDFVKYCFPSYESSAQFRAHQQFLIENTDAALLLYDEENETKLSFFIEKMRQWTDYPLDFIGFEELQEIAENNFEE